jgi:flagellar motor switch protein FliG
LTDHDIQRLLREVDQSDMVVALKGADEALRARFLDNMSEQVRAYIVEEMRFRGPMYAHQVEQVQLRIVQQVRQLEEQGQVTVVRGDPRPTLV